MARRKKDNGDVPAPASTNGYDPDKVQNAVARIEALIADKASIMGTAMSECKAVQADIKLVYDEAKEAGIPKKALRTVIKARELERKAAAVRDNLEAEDQDQHDLIRHALGDLADTPLGRAAMGDGLPSGVTLNDDDRDLRPPFLQEKDAAPQ